MPFGIGAQGPMTKPKKPKPIPDMTLPTKNLKATTLPNF